MQKTISSQEGKLFLRLLREAREKAGVSQTQLAERLTESQSFISKCERGERRLDVVELRAWCHALKISFSAFVAEFDQATQRRR
jgi:transcriptional regulator with XRE-family HTH domain